jgi:hypothetical protein
VTETPAVKEALDELREELGTSRVPLGELVALGARAKTAELRRERARATAARARLIERVRNQDIPGDLAAADEVRRRGWARPT